MEDQKGCSCRTELRFQINTFITFILFGQRKVHYRNRKFKISRFTDKYRRASAHTLFERTTVISKNARGCDSTATCHKATGWTDRRSNPGAGEISRTCQDRSWGPHNLLQDENLVSFPGVKRPVRGVNQPPQSSAEVKERVEL